MGDDDRRAVFEQLIDGAFETLWADGEFELRFGPCAVDDVVELPIPPPRVLRIAPGIVDLVLVASAVTTSPIATSSSETPNSQIPIAAPKASRRTRHSANSGCRP